MDKLVSSHNLGNWSSESTDPYIYSGIFERKISIYLFPISGTKKIHGHPIRYATPHRIIPSIASSCSFTYSPLYYAESQSLQR